MDYIVSDAHLDHAYHFERNGRRRVATLRNSVDSRNLYT